MKRQTKKVIKKSINLFKKAASKNKYTRKSAIMLRNAVFPGIFNSQNIYDHRKYYPSVEEYYRQTNSIEKFKHQPLISIVMPTYNTPEVYLRLCIESVILQSYPNWELCIADDASPSKIVTEVIEEYARTDKRVKLVKRKKNGHISEATNSAIDIAKGEFIALLDHDDVLWPNALYEIVSVINNKPDIDFIYTDEDKVDSDNEVHSYPFFKPDWSPEFLESCNYITHFSCIRKTLVDKIGGFRVGYEGAQDWDLFVRLSEATSKIHHIPKILYSWRIHEASTASDTDAKPYVYDAQRKLLVDHVARLGEPGIVKQGVIKQHSSIQYEVIGRPKVSIIVQSERADTFKKCLESIDKNTAYDNLELILISKNPKQQVVCRKYISKQSSDTAKIIAVKHNISFAESYNIAAKSATGEYMIFIDGRIIIKTPEWLEFLLGDAQRKDVGIVGGKTLFKSGDRILRAACATGIYALYAPLLEGMPAEDVHYLRGLYGQSRRNVSAIDSGCIMMSKNTWDKIKEFSLNVDDMFIVDACLSALSKGYRNIYNPFIEIIDQVNLTAGDLDQRREKKAAHIFSNKWKKFIDYDPYFNEHFVRTNAQLDIK